MNTRPPLVQMLGYVTLNDGGAGPPWSWEAGSSTTVDHVLTCNPTSGPAGRYKRLLNSGSTVHAKWANVGLGSANDTSALQTLVALPGAHAIDFSGCNVTTQSITVDNTYSCPGMFSDGSGTFNCAVGTSNGTFLVQVKKSNFYVEKIVFDLPISTTPGAAPNCSHGLSFLEPTQSVPTDRQRVTACKFIGSSIGLSFRNSYGNYNAIIENNEFFRNWGVSLLVTNPKNAVIRGNKVSESGYDSGQTAGNFVIASASNSNPAENIIITHNILNNCQIGYGQESMDFFGQYVRNLIIAHNIIDQVTYGAFEFKTNNTAVANPDFYGDVLIHGNMINFRPSTAAIGIALNNNGSNDTKCRNFKISGNYLVCDNTASTSLIGVAIGGYNDVSVTDNKFKNLGSGVQWHATNDSLPGTSLMTNISIENNNIDVIGAGIVGWSSRKANEVWIRNNRITAVDEAITLNDILTNNCYIEGNHGFSTNGAGLVIRNLQNGAVMFNTFRSGANNAMLITGTASNNVHIENNKLFCSANAISMTSGNNIVIINNKASIPTTFRFIGATGGSYRAAHNIRGTANVTPTTAGSLGDMYYNDLHASGTNSAWICTTAGNAGVAVYKGLGVIL
jgi:hypothetical protein